MSEDQPWGRNNRRARRKTERSQEKQKILPKRSRKAKAGLSLTLVGLALGFASWGYSVISPEPNAYIGFVMFFMAASLFLGAFWAICGWRKWIKVPIVVVTLVGVSFGDYHYIRYITRPSFVYVSPAAVFNGNSWDFVVNHRGPKTSYSVQIQFIDNDRLEAMRAKKQEFTLDDFKSIESVFSFPEVNPLGRGTIFAQQFIWTPYSLEHEHYSISITARDKLVYQELQVERVDGKWVWATQVKDQDTKKLLIDCSDIPYSNKGKPPCFPTMAFPGA